MRHFRDVAEPADITSVMYRAASQNWMGEAGGAKSREAEARRDQEAEEQREGDAFDFDSARRQDDFLPRELEL